MQVLDNQTTATLRANHNHLIPTGTMNRLNSNHFFDLFQFIQAIHAPEVAAQVAQSTAWRVDTLIVSAARLLHRSVKEELHTNSLDALASISADLNEQAFAEQSFEEVGSSNTGSISTIKQLHYQREAWHELARRMTEQTVDWQGRPRIYEVRTIEEQIFEPGIMRVGQDSKRKLKIGATRIAEAYGMPDAASQLYQSRLDRAANKLVDVGENMKLQAAGVAIMFQLALDHDTEIPQGEVTAYFSSLSLDLQRQLIDNAIKAAERAEEFAANDRNVRDNDYDLICISTLKVVQDLRALLKSPRFTHQAAQTQAAETATG